MQTGVRFVLACWLCMLAVSLAACSLVGAAVPDPQPGTKRGSTPTATADLQPLFVPQSAALIEPVNASSLAPSSLVTFEGANSFVWLPQGDGVVLAGQEGVALVDIPDGAALIQSATLSPARTVPSETPSLLTTASETAVVAWASLGYTINILNTSQITAEPITIQSDAPVTGLALAQSGDEAAYATFDGMIFVLGLGENQNPRTWAAPAWLANLSISPDGSQLAGVDPASFKLYILDTITGQVLRTLKWPESSTSGLRGVYLNRDWSKAAWVSQAVVQLMNVSDGVLGPILLHQEAVSAVAWSPDGDILASAAAELEDGQYKPVVLLWDAANGELLSKLDQPAPVGGLAFSPDGRQLAVLNTGGGMQTWSVSR